MYFQVWFNSAYPQHSGERYRTNGHLVAYPTGISATLTGARKCRLTSRWKTILMRGARTSMSFSATRFDVVLDKSRTKHFLIEKVLIVA